MNLKRFLAELQRRNVYRVAVAYAAIGWLLVQVATQVFPFFDVPDWAVRLLVVVVLFGCPIALVLAWAFELTPEGIVRTGDAPPQPQRRGFRKLTALLVVAVGLALGLFLFQKFRNESAAAAVAGERSIAVLPLVNGSGDPAQEYFSDGLSEQLIVGLAQIPELRVIGRSSSFRFKGRAEDARAVGEALGVGHLLEGSVRKSGDRVRISVALVNTSDGSQRWSENYDRELKDIFAVQEEIAEAVAEKLRITLLGRDIKAPAEPSNQNLDAYNAFLLGEFYFARFNTESTRRSIEFYQEAVRLDPQYARAHAALAWAFCRLGFFTGAEGREAFVQARAAAKRALELRNDVPLAHSAVAYVHMNLDWNLAAAEAVLLKSAELNPRDSGTKNVLAILRSYQNRREEGLALRRQAVALDPLNVILQGNLASDLTALGRYDEAEAVARGVLKLQPDASQIHYLIARISLQRGQPDLALRQAELEKGTIYRHLAVALAHTARGDRGAADAALETMLREHAEDNPFRVALVYAARGEGDKVFEWLERAYTAHDPRVINTASEDILKPYHSDPRFIAFCRKVGLTPPSA